MTSFDAPAPPPPDDKDWTWVLERVCGECGFDVRSFPREQVGPMIRDNAVEWRAILDDDPDRLRRRPDETTWSALEYACHVRDVLRLYDERLALMLAEDGPRYPNWDQDETAVEARYDLAEPSQVATELARAAERMATRFDDVSSDGWDRTGFRGDGASFTVETFARYLIHDPVHHVHDVEAGFTRLG